MDTKSQWIVVIVNASHATQAKDAMLSVHPKESVGMAHVNVILVGGVKSARYQDAQV